MLTLDKIYHAAFVLKDVARKTDLIEAPKLSKDCQLYLKTENLQATGSFKVRGAYYKISQLSEEESAKGVIACSAGNHAQGVALAATRRGIRSIVCMPDGAPLMKVENTKNLGAEVCLVPGTYDEAHDKAVQLQKEYDMTFIHPYDDEQVIAGQGTIGLEILDQLPDVDAVVVPVAAVLFHKLPVEGKKVACVVSGGNIDVNILNRVITRGLVMSGRKANMTIALEDKPGQLKKVAEIVSRCGSNVVSVQHDGSDPNMPISSCFLKLTLETRDAEQIEQIRAELAKEGFQLVSERV